MANAPALGLEPPVNRHGTALRTWVRALAGMQKEALVLNGATGRTWRLVSDEGPYLAGWDVGPCPLSFLTTGMVASYLGEIRALATRRAILFRDIRLTLDNRYTMDGSLLRGTMRGGALDPELHVEIDANADEATLRQLVTQAMGSSTLHGLMRGVHTSLFALTHNGRAIPVGRVAPLATTPPADFGDGFARVTATAGWGPGRGTALDHAEAVIRKTVQGARIEGIAHGVGSSLQDRQRRQLHVRGTCTQRADGVMEIEQTLVKPIGSTFRYLCDERPPCHDDDEALRARRPILAPDAATYIAAGIGFCFMTQLGRFATIQKKPIDAYRIVQDAHFSRGAWAAAEAHSGAADPIETHVFLSTDHDDGYARMALDTGEQTCFLHAFCRTELQTRLYMGAPRPLPSTSRPSAQPTRR